MSVSSCRKSSNKQPATDHQELKITHHYLLSSCDLKLGAPRLDLSVLLLAYFLASAPPASQPMALSLWAFVYAHTQRRWLQGYYRSIQPREGGAMWFPSTLKGRRRVAPSGSLRLLRITLVGFPAPYQQKHAKKGPWCSGKAGIVNTWGLRLSIYSLSQLWKWWASGDLREP